MHCESSIFLEFGYLDKTVMAAPNVDMPSSPAGQEEAMDVGGTKFEENVWYKKYQLLKRKCSEFEQLNDVLFSRAKKIHVMIEKAEAEKRSLMKRLKQFEVVEFPKTRQDYNRRSPDSLSELDCASPYTASRVRGELEATKGTASKLNSVDRVQSAAPPPPPLLGPFSNDSQTGIVTTPRASLSLHPPPTSVTLSPVTATVPVAIAIATPPSSAPVGRGTRWTKRDGGGSRKGSKRRRGDIDPNAPKKPSNAFFWFCQDKRAALQEQVKIEGLGGQHDLTKALARLWSETKTEDKKIYYEKYVTDKARYDREMEEYHRSKQGLTAMVAAATPTQRVPPILLKISEKGVAEP